MLALPLKPTSGVNTAVYTSGSEVAARAVTLPWVATISAKAKSTGASLKRKRSEVVSPLFKALTPLVMLTVGASVSSVMTAALAVLPVLVKLSV